uniref:Uncharacterized protein n=1 Tax=Cacopsylla melanoneura TaxID=428564 RepID=A0A8D9B922_9HEMI
MISHPILLILFYKIIIVPHLHLLFLLHFLILLLLLPLPSLLFASKQHFSLLLLLRSISPLSVFISIPSCYLLSLYSLPVPLLFIYQRAKQSSNSLNNFRVYLGVWCLVF